ncbi:response regulator [Alkalinema sp. FACHB-956]|nr:response regulator [Alkalinema sp. FACHB-956]
MGKILVIEDEGAIRANIEEILMLSNYDPIVAPDGLQGLQLAEQTQPDLILCDVMMPELDGHGVLHSLRQKETTAGIPFIFLTAKADRRDLRQGMEAGADDYLTKPFTADELLRAVSTQLTKQAISEDQTQSRISHFRDAIKHALPHELNTPLNGILCSTDLLLNDRDALEESEIVELLEFIRTSAKRLHHLTQNALLYLDLEMQSRLGAPPIRSASDAYEINDIVQHTAREVAHRWNRSPDLHIDLQRSTAGISAEYMEKIAIELIDNAFKFSEQGTPVKVIGRVAQNSYCLDVIDQGRGMNAQQIKALGAYVQFERSTYEQQGIGLGLIIAKRLIEWFGGKLTLTSQLDLGTHITVHLPAAVPASTI